MDSQTDISSLQNPKVKLVVKLRDRRDREKTGLFLIEGYRELLRAKQGNHPIETLMICPELFLGTNELSLIDSIRSQGATVLSCSKQVFQKMSYRDRPDGLIAIAPQSHLSLKDLEKQIINTPSPFLIVAEAIEKPGNLGTILRSSDAVNLDALIVCDRCTDIHNPNVVRASVGALFNVPIIESESPETINWLKHQNIKILAATPSATVEYTEVDMTQPLAIAVGTEQLGLSDVWMDQADIQVRIPMCGIADSLNVATATTLLMYEALRQRRLNHEA
ncbi:MAG: RNA methyltransferase [Chlamydiota bacterium]